MKTFESNWTDRQGLRFYSRGWEPEKKPKAVVALVHGLGEHSGRWGGVGEALTSAGYSLMAFDLRGHGRSGGPRGHIPSFEAYMQDIDLFLEQVRSRYPGLPIFLYGHSLGGVLVLNYGLRRKPQLKGVIATGAGLRTALEQQPVKIMMAKVLGTIAPKVLMPSGLDASRLSRDPQVEQVYLSDPLVHDRISLAFGKFMLGAVSYALQHASEFPLPLLLMHGGADQVAFPSGSREFAAALDGRARLVVWDDLYHEIHNEPQKAQVMQTAIDWMEERLKEK